MSCFCFSSRRGVRASQAEGGGGDSSLVPSEMELKPSSSSSSAAFRGSFPDLPIGYNDLKILLRAGLMPEARLFWWPLLPRIPMGSTMKSDPKIKTIATALYLKTKALLSPDCKRVPVASTPSTSVMDNDTTREETLKLLYSERVTELLDLLAVLYDIPEPGLVSPLLGILVLMIPSIDLCLQVCFDLFSRQDWFLPLSTAEHRLNVFSFKKLLKKHLPDEYTALEETGGLQSECLDLIFVNFFQTIFPFQFVARVLDCYLLEGIQVLFNFGLGLIFLNRDLVHLCESPDASHSSGGNIEGQLHPFWKTVRQRCFLGELKFSALVEASFASANQSFFSLPFRFGRKSVVSSEEVNVYKRLGKETMSGESLREPLNLGYARSDTTAHFTSSSSSLSTILNSCAKSNQKYLLALLPTSAFTRPSTALRCVFSTHQDGWSLDTLYRKTLHLAPCVLILRSLQQNIILGAYFSVPMSPPSKDVRGNGRTFVFRLDGEASTAYRWSGNATTTNTTTTSCSSSDEDNEEVGGTEVERESTVNQFFVAAQEYLAVGGGRALGSNALRIDADLSTCSAGPSDTFQNAPLAPEEVIQPFMIGELEVLHLCEQSSVSEVLVPTVSLNNRNIKDNNKHNSSSNDAYVAPRHHEVIV